VVNGVLIRPYPYPEPDRLVLLRETYGDGEIGTVAGPNLLDWAARTHAFASLAAWRGVGQTLIGAGEPEEISTALVSSDFFRTLGVAPIMGRGFLPGEDHGPGTVAVMGEGLWRSRFGADPKILGRTLDLGGTPYTVVGVVPVSLEYPSAQLWLPLGFGVGRADDRDSHSYDVIARLKPGVGREAAQRDLSAVARGLASEYPKTNTGRGATVIGFSEDMVGSVRPALLLLLGAVGFVLLIACANVANIFLARASTRHRELAIRAALGAGRGHLIRQLLVESVVLGIAGGALGLLLSSWLLAVLLRIMPSGLPRTDAIRLDVTVMVVTLLASLATGLLFGILPALQASRTDAGSVIKESGDRGSRRARGRSALVIAEIALTLVLLAGAGLLANSFLRLQRVDSGFRSEHVTIADLMVPQNRYPKGADQTGLYRRLLEGLSARPELQAIGVGFPQPFHGESASGSFSIEGRAPASRGDRPFAHIATVSGGYFSAMGIPLLSGRTFTDRDGENAQPVAIVSAALANEYWPGENPVGKRLRFEDDPPDPWVTIVGLVGDTRQLGLSQRPTALLYFPYEQFALPFTSVAVRSTLPPSAVASMLKSQLAGIDRDLSFGGIKSLQSVIDRSVDDPRFRATLIGVFAVLALALAAVGVYGLISYTVAQRTREFGIRIALGAARGQVLGPVIREGLVLAAIGIGLGLAGALIVGRALSAFLFGVGSSDPLTFALVAVLMLAVAFLATYVPSRRALKVDPVTALRAE